MFPFPLLAIIQSPLFKYAMMLIVVAGFLFGIYVAGERNVQAKWDAEKEIAKKERDELIIKANSVTVRIEKEYVDRVKTVEVKGDTIIKYVDRYITAEENAKYRLPNNFILFHDDAVKNVVPLLTPAK